MKRKKRENAAETKQPCPKCSSPLYRRTVQVVRGSCWKCYAPMPIAFGSDGLTMMSPAEFVPLEVEAAMKMGALLREHFSNTTQTSYLASTCQSCGTFCGAFYLHEFWEAEPMAPPAEMVLGCAECFTAVAINPASDGGLWVGPIPHEEDDEPEIPPPTPAPPAPALPKTTPKTTAHRSAPAPVSLSKVAPNWGRCGECGASACPVTVNEGRFYCSQCRGVRPFVPDSR